MANLNETYEKEKLVYKKCCNYACECTSDELRKLLGLVANDCRTRIGASGDELKND